MNVIQKNLMFRKKKENGKKYKQGNRGWRGYPSNVQDCSTNNKIFSFLFTSNFGSFLTDNIALTAFIIGKENDNVDIALRRGDILQGQYPAFIHLHRRKIY